MKKRRYRSQDSLDVLVRRDWRCVQFDASLRPWAHVFPLRKRDEKSISLVRYVVHEVFHIVLQAHLMSTLWGSGTEKHDKINERLVQDLESMSRVGE